MTQKWPKVGEKFEEQGQLPEPKPFPVIVVSFCSPLIWNSNDTLMAWIGAVYMGLICHRIYYFPVKK